MWVIPMGHYLGLFGLVAGIGYIASGLVPAWWLLVWFAFHILGSLMFSVGLHRYFSHGSFKTNKFWHTFMAYYSVLLLNGSPPGWAAAHNTHHEYSDTPRDIHITHWTYMIHKRYRNVPMVQWRLKQLVKDKTCNFVHRYGCVLWIAMVSALALISWKFLLFGYLMALGSVQVIGSIHQVFNHSHTLEAGSPHSARDMPWMEYILPAAGEWIHKYHHDAPWAWDYKLKWWYLDYGGTFIKLIKTRD